MAVLLQSTLATSTGVSTSVLPQNIPSGTLYGQYQLRGSILVIKDNLNTASGYIAFGTSMTAIPTSPTTGTGIYIDYRGIYGNASGTPQFYLQSSDGKAYAGGGAVSLGVSGIILDVSGVNGTKIKWYSLSNDYNHGAIWTQAAGTDGNLHIQVLGKNAGDESQMQIQTLLNGVVGAQIYLYSNGTSGAEYVALDAAGGVMIGDRTNAPASNLHVASTAPSFRMEDTTASAKSLLITVDGNAATFEEAAGTDILVLDLANGAVFIGDNSNAFNTKGLTINQGAADDSIVSLKSSDVAHGMTDLAETDTYAALVKAGAADGGVVLAGYTEATIGVRLAARHTTDDTNKATTAVAPVLFTAQLKSSATVTDVASNANIAAFRNNATTRFILDGDGDSHQDVGTAWTNFDSHDDVALLNLVSAHVTRKDDPLRENFGAWLEQSRDELERLKLVTFNADGHHFVNWSRMQMLQIGALRQMNERLEQLERVR